MSTISSSFKLEWITKYPNAYDFFKKIENQSDQSLKLLFSSMNISIEDEPYLENIIAITEEKITAHFNGNVDAAIASWNTFISNNSSDGQMETNDMGDTDHGRLRPDCNIGDRVGCIHQEVNDKTTEIFGYGTYLGDEVPDSEDIRYQGIPLHSIGLENPKILLDNGKMIWGCECWWAPEKTVQDDYLKGKTIVEVDIEAVRNTVLNALTPEDHEDIARLVERIKEAKARAQEHYDDKHECQHDCDKDSCDGECSCENHTSSNSNSILNNLIHQKDDGKWYFWNETWSKEVGPYDTKAETKQALHEYAMNLYKTLKQSQLPNNAKDFELNISVEPEDNGDSFSNLDDNLSRSL